LPHAVALGDHTWKEYTTVARTWQTRSVSLTLPLPVARSVWSRAVQWDISEGGRFEVRNCRRLLIWPGAGEAPPHVHDEPIGSISIRWHAPTQESATISRLGWHPAAGGSEALVWRALQTLAGPTGVRY
jgi:hypothetical protein